MQRSALETYRYEPLEAYEPQRPTLFLPLLLVCKIRVTLHFRRDGHGVAHPNLRRGEGINVSGKERADMRMELGGRPPPAPGGPPDTAARVASRDTGSRCPLRSEMRDRGAAAHTGYAHRTAETGTERLGGLSTCSGYAPPYSCTSSGLACWAPCSLESSHTL